MLTYRDPQASNVEGGGFEWEARPLELATSVVNANETLRVFIALLLSFLDWYRPPEIDLQKYLLTNIKLPFDVDEKC